MGEEDGEMWDAWRHHKGSLESAADGRALRKDSGF